MRRPYLYRWMSATVAGRRYRPKTTRQPTCGLAGWGNRVNAAYLVVLASCAGRGTSADCRPSLARMP